MLRMRHGFSSPQRNIYTEDAHGWVAKLHMSVRQFMVSGKVRAEPTIRVTRGERTQREPFSARGGTQGPSTLPGTHTLSAHQQLELALTRVLGAGD